MVRHPPSTVLFASPYPSFSLAAANFSAVFGILFPTSDRFRFLARDYSRFFSSVDLSFVKDVLLFKPQVIGFSCFFWNLDQNIRLASLAKSLDPSAFIVVGGPQVGRVNNAVELLKEHAAIDAIICGEADLSFPELAYRFLSGLPIGNLDGLVLKKDDHLVVKEGLTHISDLKEIPLVFHDENEYVVRELNRNDVVPFQTLRGCTNHCSYCLYPSGGIRLFPLERIEKEVAFLCDHRVRHVRVCDSHFGGAKKRAMELFEMIGGLNRETTFYVYPDPSHIDRDYLKSARGANCRFISLGVETLDPSVSTAVNRKLNTDRVREILSLCRETDGIPQIDIMLGLPNQTARSLAQDLVRLRLERAEEILFSPLMLFPGTDLAESDVSESVRKMMTPQAYSFSSLIGQEGYSKMILLSEAYRLLRFIHRTDWYIRHELNNDSLYSERMNDWFDTSRTGHEDALLDVCEHFRASSEHIRSRPTLLSARIRVLLEKRMNLALGGMEFIDEVLHMDILEAAMSRRSEELRRDIQPNQRPSGIVFPDEVVHCEWAVNKDAWLWIHAAPRAILAKGKTDFEESGVRQVFCLYFCPTPTIFFLGRSEYFFLERFKNPSYIFDEQNPYSTTTMDIARKWVSAGVLIRKETDSLA